MLALVLAQHQLRVVVAVVLLVLAQAGTGAAVTTWPGNATLGGYCAAPTDLVFVVPSGETLGLDGLRHVQEFVIALSRVFYMSPDHTRMAVVQYAEQAYTDVGFSWNRLRFEERVQYLRWRSQTSGETNPWCDVSECTCDLTGFTCDPNDRTCCNNVEAGLAKAADLLSQQKALDEAAKIDTARHRGVVLVVDAIDSRGTDPQATADALRDDGIAVVVVIGDGHGMSTSDKAEAAGWSSESNSNYITDISAMRDNIDAMRRDYLCKCPFDCNDNGDCNDLGECDCNRGDNPVDEYCATLEFPYWIPIVAVAVAFGILGAYALITIDRTDSTEKQVLFLRKQRKEREQRRDHRRRIA